MRIIPVQNNNVYSQQAHKNTNFKGAMLDAAMRNYEKPASLSAQTRLFKSLIKAVSQESGLKIINKELFDKLLNCRTVDCFGAFFYDAKHEFLDGLSEVSNEITVDIAKDNQKSIMSLKRIDNGLEKKDFIEFSGNNTKIELGYSKDLDEKNYSFYQDEKIYVDYHDNYAQPGGGVRQFKNLVMFVDPEYYDRNGNKEYFASIKNLVRGLKSIYKS